MSNISDFCAVVVKAVNDHDLRLLTVTLEDRSDLTVHLAGRVPAHYATAERLASILEGFGKPAAAEFLRNKLPETANIRSGDLGEITATEYVEEDMPYSVPIRKLRWKDHREMPLRGDDLIGIRISDDGGLQYLKGEVKSRKALHTQAVTDAREALADDFGLPSAHSLSYVADRLKENGQEDLANAIDDSQWRSRILERDVAHLIFTLSQNDPEGFLEADLENFNGAISQNDVGLRITDHQEFIAGVYEVVVDGDDD